MTDTQLVDIIDKLGEATDALMLVERAAEADKDSPLVLGCGFVEGFIKEAVAQIEALRVEAQT